MLKMFKIVRLSVSSNPWPIWLCAVLVTAAVLFVRTYWSFEFPVVWPDETTFLAQAFELYRNGTLYVWGLNDERTVMWMPPGYFILMAGIYEVFGYSFDISRWTSAFCYLVAFAGCLGVVSRALAGWRQWLALVLLTVTFVAPYTLVMSNIARMDAFYTAVFILSMLLAIRGLPGLGLALVLMGAVVHFNAVYFLLPYVVLIGWKIIRLESWNLKPIELMALVIAAVVLGGYGLYVLDNLQGFIEDMRFQFAFKDIDNPMGGRHGWLLIGALLSLGVVQLIINKSLSIAVWVTLYGVSFYALGLNGKAMWYAFSFNIGLCLVMIGVLIDSLHLVHRNGKRLLGVAFISVLCLFTTNINSGQEHLDSIMPTMAKINVPLLRDDEIQEVRQIINSLPQGSSVTFGVSGMAPFFFEDIANSGVKWAWLTKSVLPGTPIRDHDYGFDCVSIWEPQIIQLFRPEHPTSDAERGCKLKIIKSMAVEGS